MTIHDRSTSDEIALFGLETKEATRLRMEAYGRGYTHDPERRLPDGAGIMLGLIASLCFWAVVGLAVWVAS